MPLFRSRNHFRVPTLKLVPALLFVVAVLLIGGLTLLAVVEPSPTVRHYEVPVTKG